ncbi:class II fructose-bisphosphate aldolase [Pelosinus sp. IPA-1]|uniref:class II fructose-bisphosphate aldolase n=1 Tax=Pelosinus sp. IPA-1 TaxID=3029569 RepID=UPI0024362623|nr:class II fructose-bisphosphate aldolase [Pelosinus sp. IPA-1]GMA98434.1 fructose-bisphosphate aldolase [Pelosinus sp. IPA-1]
MALITLENALESIGTKGYGIGAFNIANMEMVMGAIQAAEELNSPIIIQVAEGRMKYSPLHLIGPVMIAAAQNAKVPVVVHLDHGSSLSVISQALELGFSSVMFDGSQYPLAQNIEMTKKIKELAKKKGASLEAEIGKVGGSEGDYENIEVLITSVKEAKQFYEETQVDALAVAIGTIHGTYKVAPNLQFNRLNEIKESITCPLVLHGGSGLTDDDFKQCIAKGVKKINIATASFESVVKKVGAMFGNSRDITYFQHSNAVVEATYENVKHHIKIFGSDNRI